MFRILALLQVAYIRGLLLGNEMQNMFVAEVFQYQIDQLGL